MTVSQTKSVAAVRCSCGSVELEAIGAPILSAVCYCDDCQEGARQIEALPDAGLVMDPDGGTPYVLYRKDRFERSKGAELLKGYKIRENSPTNRVVATCCNSAMFVSYDRGPHWVAVYRARFVGDVPPLDMRVNTRFKPRNGDLPGDVPSYSTFPLKFVTKLLAARIAMLVNR